MLNRVGLWAVGIGALVVVTNTGCYYDQLLQEQRANRVLQEQLTRAKDDLHDCESMKEQLNAKVDALNGQVETLKASNASLMAENESNRAKLAEALAALKEMAGKGIGGVEVVTQQLPPALDKAIQDFVDKYPGLVEKHGNAVRWKSDLLFPLGSDNLGDQVAGPLREFAQILKSVDAQGFDVIVVGHTCTTPIAKPETRREHKTNWHLSAHRAISVMTALRSDGVPEPRMGVMGYGEWRPIAANDTEANKAKNRRVEIFLVPSDQVTSTGTAGVYQSKGAGAFAKPSEMKSASPGARTAPKPGGAAKKPPAAPADAPAEAQ